MINVHDREKHEHSIVEIKTIAFIGELMGSVIAKSLLEEETYVSPNGISSWSRTGSSWKTRSPSVRRS